MPALEQQLLDACYNFNGNSEQDVLKKVQELIRHGASVNAQNKSNGKTALHYTVTNKLTTVIEFLLNNKAPQATVDFEKRTVLHYAVLTGDANIVQLIVRKCLIDLHKVDKHDKTPLDYAFEEGNKDIVEIFLQLRDFNADREHYGIVSLLTIASIHAHFAKDAQSIISQLKAKGFSLPGVPIEQPFVMRKSQPLRQQQDTIEQSPPNPADTTPLVDTLEAWPQRTWRCAHFIIPIVISAIVALAVGYGVHVWHSKKQKPDAVLLKIDEEHRDEETVAWLYDEQLQEEAKE